MLPTPAAKQKLVAKEMLKIKVNPVPLVGKFIFGVSTF